MNRGRAPIDSGRYVLVEINGTRQWARDQVALQAEIIALLQQQGGMPKKRIITALGTAQAAIETALNSLLNARKIERYKALSVRNRMDEHWCIFGQSPAAQSNTSGTRYNSAATLTAMQQHAMSLYAGVHQ